MKTLLNRIGVCGTQAANHNTMSNTNTPRSAREMQSNNGWQVDDRVMSSESPTIHLLITYYSPTIVSMQSAAIKAVKRAYMSAWRYAAMLLIVLVMGIGNVWGANGDVLFSQNFGSATAVAYSANTQRIYTSHTGLVASSGDNLFQSIRCTAKTKCGIAINTTSGANSYATAGTFQAYANNTSWKWSLWKTTNFATTAPTAIKFEMDVTAKYIASTKQEVAVIVGSGFSAGDNAPAASAGYTGFNIISGSSSSAKHCIGKVGGTTKLETTGYISNGTAAHITWVINASGSTLTYIGPDAKSYTVANAKYDLWVGTTRVLTGQDRATTGSSTFTGTTMQNLYIGNAVSGKHEVILDNIVVTDLTPATNRTFNSGEIVYFKDNTLSNLSGSAWKNSGGNIYAYFFGDGTAWSTYGDLVEGSWNAANAIYKFTVPGSGKKFTTVIFTRGTAATFDSGLWNQTTDQTTDDQCNNLFTISNTKSGDKFTGSWSKWDGTLVVTRGGTEATAAAGIDCSASAGTLTCSATRGTIKTYQWKQTTSDKAHATNAVGTGTTTASFTPNTSTAGTYYYYCVCTDACGNTAETALSGAFKYNATAATYSVTHTLTNVTKTSGTTGAGAATNGVAYTAIFSANSGYTLPDAITVTIGGAAQTAGTGYTWTKGTGTVIIPAAKVTGNIVITVVGVASVGSLSLHTPGTYEAAVGSGGYGKSLKAANGRDYEVYMFNSSTLRAGSATTVGDGLALLTVSEGEEVIDSKEGWIAIKAFGGGAGSTVTAVDEFSVTSGTDNDKKTHYIPIQDANYIKLRISGYDQFSFIGRDNHASNAGKQFIVKVDGVAQSYTHNATDNTVFRFNITTSEHTIEILGNGANSNRCRGFSLRLPIVVCTAPTGLTAGSVTTTGATFTVTDAANTNNYEFYYSTSSTAPTSSTAASATSTSKTKAVTGLTAGTTYYAWVRSVCSSTNKSAWVKLTGNSFTTLCTAPTSVSITGTYHYFPGETISLTATPTGGAGAATYQWQKKNAANTDWVNISGATAATYTKASCDTTDASAYRCTVTCGTSCAKTSDEFEVKILQLYVYYNGTLDKKVAFTKGEGSVANAAPRLEGQRTYQFLIYDGCGHWYGNSGTMTSSNCTNWTMDKSNGTKCGITTNTKSADYAFALDYSGMPTYKVSITYPGSNETAGKVIYWDNETVNWADVYYRIGRGDHTQATQMTLVPGTANLYTVTTAAYDNFEYWQICNNAGWTGSNNPIDKTKTGDGYAITNSSEYYGSQVPLATSTYTPTDSHATGETDATNNCQFYVCNYASGMKTWKLTVSNPGTNGTLDVNYDDVTGAGQVIHGPGNQTLAHTCICIPTAVAYTGYEVASLTVNGVAQTNREPFHLTEASTVAVTFAAKTYTVTLNNQSATTAGTASVTTTYNASTNLTSSITCPTKTNYVFGGYFTETNGGGVQLIDATGAWKANVTGYTNGSKVWQHDGNVTLYAKWDANSCITITNFETTQHSKSDNKPDSRSKYIYGYKGSMTDANAVTMTITETNSKGEGGGDYFKLHYGKDVYIYSNNTTTGGTPTTFEDVTSVTLKVKLYSTAPTMTIKVGSTTIANTESLGSANTSGFTTFGPYAADNLDGVISIKNNGSGSTNYDIYIDDIEICTSTTGYVLSYNANGGTGTMATQSGTTLTVANSTFTRDGYAFNGWNTKANGTGTAFAAGSSITLTKDSTLYAQWVEEMASECSWAYYFVKASDATANSKTNNTSVFTTVLGGSPGSGGSSGSATVDGTKFNFTGGSGSVKSNTTVVIPSGNKATLYIVTKKNGTNTITVKKGSTTIGTHTPTSDWDVAQFDDLDAGTYTINSSGNLNWYLFAANICADCADSRPEITGSLTGCPTVTLTATNYTDGALLQWYKKVGSDFVALDGETGTTYTARETGLYKLAAQKTCRLETEPVSVTISLAVNTISITSPTTTYDQGATASPITSSVLAEGSAATSASEYKWEKSTDSGSSWTEIDGATSSSYTPSTASVGTTLYRAYARNNCNEGTWKRSGNVTINVIASSTVTCSWKYEGGAPTNPAYQNSVKSGGWYNVTATFSAGGATPTLTAVTTGIKIDNRVVDGRSITARVYVPATGYEEVVVKAAVEASTVGVTNYSACESTFTLNVIQCASATGDAVKILASANATTPYNYSYSVAGVGAMAFKNGNSSVSTTSDSHFSSDGFTHRNSSNKEEYRIASLMTSDVSKVRVYIYNPQSKTASISKVYQNAAVVNTNNDADIVTPLITYYTDAGVEAENIAAKGYGYIDIALSTPLSTNGSICLIFDQNVNSFGCKLYGTGSGMVGTTPTIVWNQSGTATLPTIETTPGSTLLQKALVSTADFRSIASIQYTSSNLDVATVNSTTGEVTITAPADIEDPVSATISAKLPASGCYKASAAITYTITVNPCSDPAPVITASRTDYCVGHEPVLSITSYDGDIVGWYKNGTLIPSTEGLTSYTVDGVGNYYVATHKTCDANVRSNSVVITASEAPSVTVIHSGWHVRRGREIGVPLQLFKVEGDVVSTTIAWTLNGAAYTLSGATCALVDGIYQLTGTPKKTADTEQATLTGTITVTNECGQTTTKSTTIIVDPYKANIQVAYVVKGTKGGGWTATQADNLTGLYTYLSSVPTFDVTACNGYNTTVLNDLLAYYSQYDVVVLTDYLNSGEKPGSSNPGYSKTNNISYSDAFGCLVDVKPMLTTEAYVSGKSQWTKVGLTSNPSDGTNTDNQSLKMRLLCPSAAIFTSIDPSTIDGEKYIQVADALPGGSENKMLQGFAPTAARDFVFMATVMGGDGKELITLCERQAQIRARMLVFGLNWHGSQVLNTDGKTAVKQMIEYLMRWDPEQVIDCAIYFNDKTGDHKWSTAANWGPAYNHVPKYYENVRIEQPVIVDVPNAVAANVRIAVNADGSNVTGASDETVTSPKVLNGEIEIPSNGSLTINGGIYKVISDGARNFVTKHQVDHHVLSVGSSSTGQGALAFAEANNDMLPDAVVAIYGRGVDGDQYDPTWQYIGIPYQTAVALSQFYNGWLCEWHQDGSWTYVGDYDRLQPFKGYALTQVSSVVYANNGLLVKPQKMSFTLQYSSGKYAAYNLLANSFTAPIDINAFEDDDFDNAEKTIYIYNTGAYSAWEGDAGGAYSQATTSAGQYLAIPIHAAPYTPLSVIPSTQAFFVKANPGGGTLTIDYDRTVLQIDSVIAGASKTTSALHAPRRRMMQQGVNDGEMGDILTTKITLQGETGGDILHVLTGSEDFTDGFDDGWDGEKWAGDSNKPYFAIHSDTMDYSVSSQPKLEGTILTFRPGVDEIYDLTIVTPVRGLVLTDLVSNIDIPLADTTYYTFSATSRTEQGRFIIRRKPQIATDNIMQTADYVSAFATNGQICVANKTTTQANASVFDATGKLIYYNTLSPNSTQFIDIPVASGVYLVRIVTGQESRTIKVTF